MEGDIPEVVGLIDQKVDCPDLSTLNFLGTYPVLLNETVVSIGVEVVVIDVAIEVVGVWYGVDMPEVNRVVGRFAMLDLIGVTI